MIHFDQKIWINRTISNKSNTAWKCGYCGVGAIQLKTEIPRSRNYSVRAKCTNCKQTFSIVGRVVPLAKGEEVHFEYIRIDDYRLYPSHFYPELVMFELPLALSDRVKIRILQSFNHFWYDLDACANKIRQAIELIVDGKGGTGKNLEQKIVSIKNQLGDKLTDLFLALKWIGNDGSHVDRPFDREEILKTYDLFVKTLNLLYPDESEEKMREDLVRLVIEKKGIKNL